MKKVKIRVLQKEGLELPKYGTELSAGADIYSFNQKRKMRERKEKRLRERELRKKYDYENIGEEHDN